MAHSFVGDAIVTCVRHKLPKLRLVSLVSVAMKGSDSSPISHFRELVSIVIESEYGESGQPTHQLADQADLVRAQWVLV